MVPKVLPEAILKRGAVLHLALLQPQNRQLRRKLSLHQRKPLHLPRLPHHHLQNLHGARLIRVLKRLAGTKISFSQVDRGRESLSSEDCTSTPIMERQEDEEMEEDEEKKEGKEEEEEEKGEERKEELVFWTSPAAARPGGGACQCWRRIPPPLLLLNPPHCPQEANFVLTSPGHLAPGPCVNVRILEQ